MTDIDKNALKVQALLERVSSLTAAYENQVADLRVEVTLLHQAAEAAKDDAADLELESK